MLDKIEVNKDYMFSTVRVTVLFIGRTSLFYKTYSCEGSCDISYARDYWSEIPVEKKPTERKLIVWKFKSCARLNKSVNFTSKEHLCNNYRKELSDLEFYNEQLLENQV